MSLSNCLNFVIGFTGMACLTAPSIIARLGWPRYLSTIDQTLTRGGHQNKVVLNQHLSVTVAIIMRAFAATVNALK